MKRNNGYIELKFNNTYSELIEKNIISLLDRNKNCFYINPLGLFFKEEESEYKELLGSRIAKLLDIDTVTYDVLEFISLDKSYKGVVSQDFRKEGYHLVKMNNIIDDYLQKTEEHIKFNEMNFDLIYKAISNRYSSDIIVNKIMDSLKRYFLFDLLIGNIDNGKYNYEFLESDIDSVLCPYFDFGQIFKFSSTRFTVSDSNNYIVYDNLYEFLIKEENYFTIFKNMYELLTPIKIEELFKEIENEIDYKVSNNIKNIVFLSYSRHYKIIGDILNKLPYTNKIRK